MEYSEERTRYRADRWPPSQRCEYIKKDGEQCKRHAVRSGRWCPFHNANRMYFENRQRETQEAQVMAQVVQQTLGSLELARRDLEEAAPEAVALLLATVRDSEAPAGARVRAAEILLKSAGVTVERVSVETGSGVDASEVIRQRLDRLASVLP